MGDNVDHFGARLGEALRRARVSQTRLAEAAGVSPGYVSTVVAGRKPPSAKLMAAIAELDIVFEPDTAHNRAAQDDVGVNHDRLAASAYEALNQLQALLPVIVCHHQGDTFDLLADVLRERPELEDHIQGLLRALRGAR